MHSQFLLESINEQLFIASDPQFGSEGLFENVHERKKFGSIDKLHQTIVTNWNSILNDNSRLLCLGDFTQNQKDQLKSIELLETYSRAIKGKKILIRGNHDIEATSWYYDFGWNCVIEYPIIIKRNTFDWVSAPTKFCGCIICEINGLRIMFSHFAIFENELDDCRYLVEKAFLRSLYEQENCSINIHGHIHNRPIDHPSCYSVCGEQLNFTPIQLGNFLSQQINTAPLKDSLMSYS